MNKFRVIAVLTLLAFLSVLALAAIQEKSEEMVKDPVCGMMLKKAEAKASFDYKDTTYYFCSASCKDKFAQDPEKYLQAKAEKAEPAAKGQGCPMMAGHMAMMHGQAGGAKAGACCPMAGMMSSKEVEFKVENTKDGVQINISSKNSETVKKIQDMAAKMKAGCDPKACGQKGPEK